MRHVETKFVLVVLNRFQGGVLSRRVGATAAHSERLRSVKPAEENSASDSRVLTYGLTNEDYDRSVNTFPGVKGAVPIRERPDEVRRGQGGLALRQLRPQRRGVAARLGQRRVLELAVRQRAAAVARRGLERVLEGPEVCLLYTSDAADE